jgi:hypothetical protein
VDEGCRCVRERGQIDIVRSATCVDKDDTDAIRYLIDVNAYRHALRKPDPGEDRIYRCEPRLVRLRVRHVDATSDAVDMATNELAVAHQLDGCRVALVDPAETSLLEVAIDPEGVGLRDIPEVARAREGAIRRVGQAVSFGCPSAVRYEGGFETTDLKTSKAIVDSLQ